MFPTDQLEWFRSLLKKAYAKNKGKTSETSAVLPPTPLGIVIFNLYRTTIDLFNKLGREKPDLLMTRDGLETIVLEQSVLHEPKTIKHNEPSGATWIEHCPGQSAATVTLNRDGVISFSLSGLYSASLSAGRILFFIEKPVEKKDGFWINGLHQSEMEMLIDDHIYLAAKLVNAFIEKQFGGSETRAEKA